ncbi:MAG TPA: TonB-dependent receptor, partial [Opitutus sp.]|nr:TonB-dependent receptor [Opitutus sp.]
MLAPCCIVAAEDSAPSPSDASSPTVLHPVTVLGSHIRHTDFEGPSAVRVYDRDYIEATGATRLADFLNLLPQNYGGASSGRGSAPNDLNPEFGVRTETSLPFFNFVLGMAAIPFGQTGVSAANLHGLGSGSTLVLVDGHRRPIAGQGNLSTDTRQGFVNLNTIPLGMIERVEILADGASALYGSDAIGGVINVVLKKNYSGAEFVTDYKGTFEGGGRERSVSLIAGFTSDDARLRGTIGIDLYDRAPLTAAQRQLSADQDHSGRVIDHDAEGDPIHGIDFRLNWSYPAVVQARTGTLNGVTRPDGSPATVALVPDGARAGLTPADFIVSPSTRAESARRMNTAAFISLISPQESRSVSGQFEYRLGENLRAYGGASVGEVDTQFDGQPPVSSASASTGFGSYRTIVPAIIDGQPNTLNPFGQDVLVGLVHHEFGPTRQTTQTISYGAYSGLSGRFADWEWDVGVNWSRERFEQRNLTLDLQKFSDSLAASDPAQRFNPFVDARTAGPVNAHLYEAMKTYDVRHGRSNYAAGSFLAFGPLRELPGGDLQLAVGGNLNTASHRAESRLANGPTNSVRVERDSFAGFAEAVVPLFGPPNARPLLRRLELQLAVRYEHH